MKEQTRAFEELSRRIEDRSPIEIDRAQFTLRLIDLREPMPIGSRCIVIVVAEHGYESHTSWLHLGANRLDGLESAAAVAAETMVRILSGDLGLEHESFCELEPHSKPLSYQR